MSERNDALASIVALARKHQIGIADIAAALSEEPARGTGVLVRVLSYIGATFVFAGIATFIAMQWDELGSAARVVVSLGSGLALFALALVALHDERYRIAATPLFIAAAVLIPVGLMVTFDEYGGDGDASTAWLITSAVVTAQFGLTYWRYRRTALLLITLFFGLSFWAVALDKVGLDGELTVMTLGAMALLLACALRKGDHAILAPLGFVFGAWAFLWGLFALVEGSIAELLFLAVACALVYLGVRLRSRSLNVVSIAAILAYTGYVTGEYFADSVGWPLALIVFGLIMIALSAVGLKIDRKYLRD